VDIFQARYTRTPEPYHDVNAMNDARAASYRLFDTKHGERAAFDTLDAARAALRAWIEMQRQAGEQVIEQDGGQWADSRLTVWISDPGEKIVRLED
jgi:hypothetical protein